MIRKKKWAKWYEPLPPFEGGEEREVRREVGMGRLLGKKSGLKNEQRKKQS